MKLLRLNLLVVAVAMAGCSKEAPQRPPAAPKSISYITIKEEPVKIQSELKGRVSAVTEAEVRPQITGIIQTIHVKDGQSVKKGQLLYKVDPSQYKAAYDQSVAAYESIKADIDTARLKSERYATLAKQKAIAIQDADDAKSAYQKLVSTLAERKASVDLAKINLDYTDIKAPIDGILGITTITPGALVTANQTNSINTITTLNPIYVDIAQPSKEFLDMRILQKELKTKEVPVQLRFQRDGEYVLTGHVISNEFKVDQTTDSIKVRAIFDNTDKLLLPGMYAYANVTYGVQPNGIKIPLQTVVRGLKGETSVFVVDSANKVQKIDIDTLYNTGSEAIVSSGLKAGDKVVFEGLDKIRNGDEVAPVEQK